MVTYPYYSPSHDRIKKLMSQGAGAFSFARRGEFKMKAKLKGYRLTFLCLLFPISIQLCLVLRCAYNHITSHSSHNPTSRRGWPTRLGWMPLPFRRILRGILIPSSLLA